jgi:hypothetical protein
VLTPICPDVFSGKLYKGFEPQASTIELVERHAPLVQNP